MLFPTKHPETRSVPKTILLNGPPRSGKDLAATLLQNVLRDHHGFVVHHHKFADPLRKAVPALFDVPSATWARLYYNEKEAPTPLLQGMSPREAMIWLSESVMKPRFGLDIFGRIAAQALAGLPCDTVVISDNGFNLEVEPLVQLLGAENLLVVQIHRPGCSFAGDSREWVWLDNVNMVRVDNDATIEAFRERLRTAVIEEWMGLATDWEDVVYE